MPAKQSTSERIERHIVTDMTDDSCWETDFRSVGRGGHPHMCVGSRTKGKRAPDLQVHRVAWECHHAQPIPEGFILLHSCDNPRCCNPNHLVLGTHKDNTHDMMSKGRASWQK